MRHFLKIEVEKVETKQVVKKATGEVFQIPEVVAYAHTGDKHPAQFRYPLSKGAQPPAPGFYALDVTSFYIGEYGKLSLKQNIVLAPLPAEAVQQGPAGVLKRA